MRRACSLMAVLALLAAPLALLARGEACAQADCCTRLCCPAMHSHPASSGNGSGDCRRCGSACAMHSSGSHSLAFGMNAPLVPVQLSAASVLPAPLAAAGRTFRNVPFAREGVPSLPFHPPRA